MRHPSIPARLFILPLLTISLLALSPGRAYRPVDLLDENGIIDLAGIFSTGYILQDRNGDGITDFADLTILLPSRPSETVVASAMSIAARIGFETTAIDLELAERIGERKGPFDQPVIVIDKMSRMTTSVRRSELPPAFTRASSS